MEFGGASGEISNLAEWRVTLVKTVVLGDMELELTIFYNKARFSVERLGPQPNPQLSI